MLGWPVVTPQGSQMCYCTSVLISSCIINYYTSKWGEQKEEFVFFFFFTVGSQQYDVSALFLSFKSMFKPGMCRNCDAVQRLELTKSIFTDKTITLEKVCMLLSWYFDKCVHIYKEAEKVSFENLKFQTVISLYVSKHPLSVRSGLLNDIKCYRQFSILGNVWLTLFECWWDSNGGVQVACWSG